MADETIESVVEDQRATDPRLEQQQAAPDPAPQADPDPQVDPDPAPLEAAAGDPDPEADSAPEPEPKKKRTAEEVLKGRVGHLTKTLSTKDAELAEERRQRVALEALLAAQGKTPAPDGETPPAPAAAPATINPNTGRTYTQAEFDQAVTNKAKADDFNRQADAMYDAGTQKFPDWKESVDMLNAADLMNPALLEAAMATDAGADVIHHLGGDLDEALRIANLSPAKMGAELTKLAVKLSAPTKVAVSSAPAPIRSIAGAVNPQIDVIKIAESDDMRAYVAARAKQGSKWAQGRTR